MQRQIRILRPIRMNSRRGFALIAAVFLMIVVSSMMLKMISYTTENTQQVLNDYLQEQAALLAYGATEYSLLRISSGACPDALNLTYPDTNPLFDIRIQMQYIWDDTIGAPAGCSTFQTVTTDEQHGIVLIDVTVSSIHATGDLSPVIRYHRRTLQKL